MGIAARFFKICRVGLVLPGHGCLLGAVKLTCLGAGGGKFLKKKPRSRHKKKQNQRQPYHLVKWLGVIRRPGRPEKEGEGQKNPRGMKDQKIPAEKKQGVVANPAPAEKEIDTFRSEGEYRISQEKQIPGQKQQRGNHENF